MEQLQALPWVVLSGPSNAGKSTLFNALLGRERAAVTAIAGTTRDALVEPLALLVRGSAAEIMLVDVAGADFGGDRCAAMPEVPGSLDAQMHRTAEAARRRSALLLECRPPGTALPPPTRCVVRVRTKCDLDDRETWRGARAAEEPGVVRVSAARREGLDALRDAIAEGVGEAAVNVAAGAVVLQPRHEAALRAAHRHLRESIDLVRSSPAHGSLGNAELVAATMRAALDELGAIAGAVTPDDVLGRIFAHFCIGK
jgi:tRNA modification GTPase